MTSTVLWEHVSRNVLPPFFQGRSVGQERRRRQAELCWLPCLAYSSTLKMEAVCFSEMLVGFHWTIRCYVPQDSTSQLTTFQVTEGHYQGMQESCIFHYDQNNYKSNQHWHGAFWNPELLFQTARSTSIPVTSHHMNCRGQVTKIRPLSSSHQNTARGRHVIVCRRSLSSGM
jgi:hypothetical protein